MEENQRPLSDFISSVEQIDAPDIPNEGIGEEPKNKKSKAFPIIVSILLVLILVAGGYYVYTNYIKDQDTPEETSEEVSDLGLGDISMELSNGQIVYVNVPTSDCDTTSYEVVERDSKKMTIWEDNQEGLCSSSNTVLYFVNEEAITEYYSENQTVYPLKKYTEDNIVYEYILEPKYSKEDDAISGFVYQKEPTVSVKEYDAFRILSFYKRFPDINESGEFTGNIINGSIINTYCVFDLSKIVTNGEGYIVFSGSGDIYSETNYCDVLNNSGNFEIKLSEE